MSEFHEMIRKSNERYETMSPDEQQAMWKAQRESWVRAFTEWPKPRYRFVDGVKVYESYEDYCA